ncbi:MAG: hypothetical protein AB8H79_15970 [Myxococcota bacterium]
MSSPFIAYSAPTTGARPNAETLAIGGALGAAIGALFPVVGILAELASGSTLTAVASAPSASLLTLCAVPTALAVLGAIGHSFVAAHRQNFDEIAHKAGTLMDESWELQVALEGVLEDSVTETVDAPRQRMTEASQQGQGFSLPRTVPVEAVLERDPIEAAEDGALIAAQAKLLHRFAAATNDATNRMQVNVRGLNFTPMSVVQRRLVDAMDSHISGLNSLASEVVRYTEASREPAIQQDPRSTRPRQAAVA